MWQAAITATSAINQMAPVSFDDIVAQMEAILQDLEQVQNGDVEALMAIDERFHVLLTRLQTTNSWARLWTASTLRVYAFGIWSWIASATCEER